MAILYINGKPFPYPAHGLNFVVSTMVNASRNALGAMVGQKIGRDQHKIDALVWSVLDAATWAEMLKEFDQFYVLVKFPDMVNNQWRTLKMYPGDRSAQPFTLNGEGFPIKYQQCKVNIIDCGEVG